MKINNRKKKIQSEKIVKELMMYLALLSSGKVYPFELNLGEDDTLISLRTFQRYAKELEETGAVPTLEITKDEEGLHYCAFKEEPVFTKPEFSRSSSPFSFIVRKADVKNTSADHYIYDYQDFNIDHEDSHTAKLSRICKMANRICRMTEEERLMNDVNLNDFLKTYYKEEVSSNFNTRTYQRDLDAVVIALNEIFNDSENKRYKEVVKMFLQGYQKILKKANVYGCYYK